MEEICLYEPAEILISPCSGGSNVRQIANEAGVRLIQEGLGNFFCLAGVVGHVSGMIESTKAGKLLAATDGGPVACAQKTLEHGGFNIGEYVQVTEPGIEKNYDFNLDPKDLEKVVNILRRRLTERRKGSFSL